ncbi:MAG TPA: S9 family peptidase [Streptosporangiaceae bacterium]|jgi:dipeptidyl aminopeptidase/acylaminoacyl peptidase|nr:S9 family peptidase [Streptosporangiaceae bacterium]
MREDLRESPEYAAVAEYVRRLHEPAFGRPHHVTDLVTTADAGRIVVTGSVYDELEGLPRTALYEVRDGGLRALTSGGGSAKAARFAPDGSALAFLSDRAKAEVFQLYLLADGQLGEARPAPAVPGTVEFLAWSPDGTRILLGAAGPGAEMADAQGSGTAGAGESGLPSWYPEVETGTPEDAWRGLWLYTPVSGELAKVSPDGLNVWEAAWSGPGHVLAITSEAPSEGDWYSAVLSRLDISTGEATELLRSDVQLGLPAGASDGTRAAVVEAVCSDRWIVAGDLIVLDLVAGTRCAVDTGGTDVTAVQWIDPTRLGYVGQRHLDSVAGIADLGEGPLPGTITASELAASAQSWTSWFYPAGAFTPDGRVVVVRDDYGTPQQIAIVGAGTDQVLASLAHAGTDYVRSAAGSAANVSWRAPDGTAIEGVLCTPAGAGPFPLVLHVHGGPIAAYQQSWMMQDYAVPLLVTHGYAVLSPNPRGSSGRGQEFAAAVVGDMGGADTYDYLSGIDAMIERGIADPARIGTMGVSYGGFMSAWLVTQDQRFKAAVAGSPVTEWYSFTFTTNIPRWGLWFLDDADPEEIGNQAHTRSPVMHASKARTPTLLTAGAKDRCTPAGQAREFYQALIDHGVASELVIYPGEGHGVRQFPAVTDYLTRLVTWFERYMPA